MTRSSEFYFDLAAAAAKHAIQCEQQPHMSDPAQRAWARHDEYQAMGQAYFHLGE